MPSTAASEPSPMATVNTSTHKMVGMERMMATKPFTAFDTVRFERFAEAASARKNDTIAEMIVHSSATARVMPALWKTVSQVKCPAPNGGSSAGCRSIAKVSESA